MSKVCFSAFSDLHHHPGVFYSQAEKRLAAIRARAEKNQVDFVISCGDFCHNVEVSAELLKAYDDFPMPVWHVIGNHDSDRAPYAETLKRFHLDCGYYFFDQNGFRFVIMDTNYVLIDGVYEHYDMGNYYSHPDSCEYIPPEEVAWLKETLESSPYPCVLFSHGSIERSDDVPNAPEVVALINAVNRKTPGKVRLVINGHHHRDFLRIMDDVVYMELNSTTYDYLPEAHDFYPVELVNENKVANHTIIYTEPVHAVITLDSDGLIDIRGMKGDYFMGITREMTPNPPGDNCGRLCTPDVLSASFNMHYGVKR